MQAMPYASGIACFFCASRRRLSPSRRRQSPGAPAFAAPRLDFFPPGMKQTPGSLKFNRD